MHKTIRLPRQALFAATTVLLSVPFIVPSLAHAQVLFQDSFSSGKLDGTGKWYVVSGQWNMVGGALVQTKGDGKTLILVTDEHWDETWVDYWFYAKVKLVEGLNGPLILWRYHSDGTEGAGFGENVPPRMKKSGRRHVIYWALNLEGKRSVIIRAIRTIVKEFEPTNTKTQFSKGVDYWIKVENEKAGYRLYLTDDQVAAAAGDYGPPIVDVVGQDFNINGEGRIGFGTESCKIEVDDVFVTAPQHNPFAVEAQGKLSATWGRLKSDALR
jgi:hypothetical protein